MAATAALSVTSAVTAIALTPRLRELGDRRLRLGLVAADHGDGGAGLRQAARHAEPDAAIAAGDDGDLAAEIEWSCCHGVLSMKWLVSALALPDQDQADRGQRRAVAGPLQLVDHEARLRPGDRAGALADPEQARWQAREGRRSEALCASEFPRSRWPARCSAQAVARVARSFRLRASAGMNTPAIERLALLVTAS